MKVLVTGGAGYIGSHTLRALAASGHEPVVFDNLSRGHREAVEGFQLIEGDLLDAAALTSALDEHRVEAVMHFAALTAVGESMAHPDVYYRNNVTGSLCLLEAMRECRVGRIIFSSSAAIYGNPARLPMDEDHPQSPVSPYGWSKLMVERMLQDFGSAFGLKWAALRYFNASGASADGSIGEDHSPETHLIPRVLMAVTGEIPEVTVMGVDWPTEDGTCVRDFVHVEDLAEAHVLALEHLARGGASSAWNLGTERGHSVREVIACAERVTGRAVPCREGARRVGDPPELIASSRRIREELDWKPRYVELEDVITSAWRWLRRGRHYAARREVE